MYLPEKKLELQFSFFFLLRVSCEKTGVVNNEALQSCYPTSRRTLTAFPLAFQSPVLPAHAGSKVVHIATLLTSTRRSLSPAFKLVTVPAPFAKSLLQSVYDTTSSTNLTVPRAKSRHASKHRQSTWPGYAKVNSPSPHARRPRSQSRTNAPRGSLRRLGPPSPRERLSSGIAWQRGERPLATNPAGRGRLDADERGLRWEALRHVVGCSGPALFVLMTQVFAVVRQTPCYFSFLFFFFNNKLFGVTALASPPPPLLR